MKKLILLLVCMLAVVCVYSCSKGKEKLYIYNWTYYTPPEVIKGFEEKYNVEVVYDEFASNEEMFAKLKAGGSGYDITFPSADYVTIMVNEGMLEKIDKNLVPNFKNIDPELINSVGEGVLQNFLCFFPKHIFFRNTKQKTDYNQYGVKSEAKNNSYLVSHSPKTGPETPR